MTTHDNPAGGAGAVKIGELGRDDLRRRAKAMLARNGWKPGNQFSAHSTIELMIALATDAIQSPLDQCAYPECGCCHDATCDEAALSPTPVPEPEAEGEAVAWRLLQNGEIIEAADQVLADDTVTWLPLKGWEIGLPYHPGFYQPARRRLTNLADATPNTPKEPS